MAKHFSAPLRHLTFKAVPKDIGYKKKGFGDFETLHREDRSKHAAFLKKQLEAVAKEFETTREWQENKGLTSDFGLILEIVSAPDCLLKIESLEANATTKVREISVLNVRTEDTKAGEVTKASVFVPFGLLHKLGDKLNAYATKDTKPKKDGSTRPLNEDLFANIESISSAALEALWMEDDPLPGSSDLAWWELWIRRSDGCWHERIKNECEQLGIDYPETRQTLFLPDHIVVVIQARREQLEDSLTILNGLSEVHRARPCSVGLTDLPATEQDEWVESAANQIVWPDTEAPAVCLLDTGVNRSHPLLEPLLTAEDSQSVLVDGDPSDTRKHGSPMAGMAAFGDLRKLMLSHASWAQLHRLESVKLINTGHEHDPENYGAVTFQAVSLPEIQAENRPRIFCMALTRSSPLDDGRPSAWSAAVDAIASGSQEVDDVRRVILVSAGNQIDSTTSADYPKNLVRSRVEDPAQAFNAITVGAATELTQITEPDPDSKAARAIAPQGGLCPYSRTSHDWASHWPIKPDFVAEGGNLAKMADGSFEDRDSLQLISTAANFRSKPLTTINATSAATALAARTGAQILQQYPELSPEAVRALLVHSARWTPEMLQQGTLDPHKKSTQDPVERILRSYGFGLLDEQRALSSFSNRTTLIFDDEIQPFQGKPGKAKLKDSRLIELPWPKTYFDAYPDAMMKLHVTLSYFIEPNPGSKTWNETDKYRYASGQLRFAVKHRDRKLDEFIKDIGRGYPKDSDPGGWAIGPQMRGKSGSLVQDIWQGSAAQLREMEHLAIYPVIGWWARRKFPEGHEHHDCHLRKIRYSVLISLETEQDLQLYSEIESAIQTLEAGAIQIDDLFS